MDNKKLNKLSKIIQTRTVIADSILSEKVIIPQNTHRTKPLLTSKLYVLFTNDDITHASEASPYLYNNEHSPHKKLHQLAHRLQQEELDKLYQENMLPILRNLYDKSRYRVYGALRQADALFSKGQIETAGLVWEKALLLARRNGMILESIICAQRLSYLYAFKKEKVKRRKILQLYERLLDIASAEHKALGLYEELVILVQGKMHFCPDKLKKSTIAVKEITRLARSFRSHSLWLTLFRTRIFHYYFTHDYYILLAVCKSFRNYLLRHKHLQQNALWLSIAHHEIYACIVLRQYKYAFVLEQEHKKYLHADSPNWFTHHENYFQLYMHAGHYEKAEQVYSLVTSSRHAHSMSEEQKEVWKIFGAYLHFSLHHSHQIRQLKVRYYFNELRYIVKDKKGMNFQVYVALVMYLLVQGNDKHMGHLKKSFINYVSRHISRKKNYRSYLFAKMLLLIFKFNGNPEEASKAGKICYQRLIGFNDPKSHDREIIEIIPYENLWIMLLQQLKQRQIRVAA